MSSNIVRWVVLAGGVGAIVAGAIMALTGLLWATTFGALPSGIPGEVHVSVPLLGMLMGIAGLYALHRSLYGSLEKTASFAYLGAFSGIVLVLVMTGAGLLMGYPLVYSLLMTLIFYAIGALAAIVGLVFVGLMIQQTRVLPRWCGILLAVGIPISVLSVILLFLSGLIVLGIVWVLLGYALFRAGVHFPQEPARVR
jgi:hypothetical protein